jgi:hypothetical protein
VEVRKAFHRDDRKAMDAFLANTPMFIADDLEQALIAADAALRLSPGAEEPTK